MKAVCVMASTSRKIAMRVVQMHKSSMLRMEWFCKTYMQNFKITATIVDFGSQCIPGQRDTYKTFFQDKSKFNYVGVDMAKGDNVDIVLSEPYIWKEIPDDFCDVLICGQVFEHIEFPWISIREIARIVKPDSLICIIVPSMCPLHRFPVNCQNYFADGMIALCKWANILPLHCSTNRAPIGEKLLWYDNVHQDTILVAKKPKCWQADDFTLTNYFCEPADLNRLATGFVPFEKQPYFKKYLIIKTLFESLKKYWKALKGITTPEKGYF